MFARRHFTVALPAALLLAATPALAAPRAASAFMPAGEAADAPHGFTEMCARDRALCLAGQTAEADPARAAPLPALPTPVVRSSALRANLSPLLARFAPGGALAELAAAFPGISIPGSAERMCLPALAPSLAALSFTLGATGAMPGQPEARLAAAPDDATAQPGNAALCAASEAEPFSAPLTTPTVAMPVAQPATPAPQILVEARPVRQPAAPQRMDGARLHKLVKQVNSQVNRFIIPVTDRNAMGVDEYWRRPVAGENPMGDCEDYAIEKRMRLMQAGFPADRLFYSVVFVRGYGLHTILIARMDDGDYVLDNFTPRILHWSKVNYVWLRRQMPGRPLDWARVGGGMAQASAQAPAGAS